MNTQEYINFIPIYIKRLEDDGFSKDTVDVGKWITAQKGLRKIYFLDLSVCFKKIGAYIFDLF